MFGVFHPLRPFPFGSGEKPGKQKKREVAWLNDATYLDYFYRLLEIAINMFEWKGLPETIDARFLELGLCEFGQMIYFDDPVIGNLCLTVMSNGNFDVYHIPKKRRAYSINGYNRELDDTNSVLIYNNYLRQPSMLTIQLYARRLYEIERAIDVNVKAQKTPVLIMCDETQLLTMKNAYKSADENMPVIFGGKNIDLSTVSTFKTDAPFVSPDLNMLKKQIWNEAMTIFGVENSGAEKRERLVANEVGAAMGSVQAQRYVWLNARRQAADKINKMFGTNITVDFRDEFVVERMGEGDADDGSIYDDDQRTAGTGVSPIAE